MADIAMVRLLHRSGRLEGATDIREKLKRIGNSEAITRHCKDAYTAFLETGTGFFWKNG